MKIYIFDVSHGFCAYLIADNGNVMLFDCGYNERTGFRPSSYLKNNGCSAIENFFVTNFDEDHISDLPNLLRCLPIKMFYRNRSIDADTLRSLKLRSGPISPAMESCLNLHADYIHNIPDPPEFRNINYITYYNNYPIFTDTNNLSLVTFINYGDFGILFPGDLEKSGWRELLKDESFRANLKKVNFFVASHHGREDGYCEEVFRYCKPEIIIISDKEIVHESQINRYAQHASGIPWNVGSKRRYVLTTRSDGMITITKALVYNTYIQTER